MRDFLDADELPQGRVDELARWLHDRNVGICEMDDDIVYNDLKSVRQLAESLLQHGPEDIRIAPPPPDRPGDQLVDLNRLIADALCGGGEEQFDVHVTHPEEAARVAEVVLVLLEGKDAEIASLQAAADHWEDRLHGESARVAELARERDAALDLVTEVLDCWGREAHFEQWWAKVKELRSGRPVAQEASEPSAEFRLGWRSAMEEIDAWANRQAERAGEHGDEPGEKAYGWCSTAALVRRRGPSMAGRLADRADAQAGVAQEAGEPAACDGSSTCAAQVHILGCARSMPEDDQALVEGRRARDLNTLSRLAGITPEQAGDWLHGRQGAPEGGDSQ